MTLQPGRRLGHYLIGPSLGAGGMGEVYRAPDTTLGREVALKVLPDAMASSPELVERFRREALAVAALNHPHIVTLSSFEEADRLHFLTMELLDGESLEQVIARGPVPVSRVLEIAEAVAGALVVAHVKGIVHRDLKPVMLTQSGVVKVLDFGLARFAAHASTEGAADGPTIMRTSTGMIMGTAPYMSPEQVQGGGLDHRTDVYSFGVLLYEVATAKRPFDGGSAAAVFAAILRDAAAPVTDARPDLPPSLADVIARCLERNPDLRFRPPRTVRRLSNASASRQARRLECQRRTPAPTGPLPSRRRSPCSRSRT